MANQYYKKTIESLLSKAGITINGDQPYDPQIHNDKFYKRVIANGSIGLGESYMDGWWDSEQLDEFFNRLLPHKLDQAVPKNFKHLLAFLRAKLLNPQSRSKSSSNATRHYDLGNEFFQAMLDKRMVYTCAYWKDIGDLDEAQEKKLELTCRKLHLEPGMKILDIGCGWGSFAKYAAEHYDVHVTGINVSESQLQYCRATTEGLNVAFRNQDYRDLSSSESFDRIVSLGMFEHVGYKNFRTFIEAAKRCLKSNGLFLLHTIGSNQSSSSTDPWLSRYIFPNSLIPSIKQTGRAMEGLFVLEDFHNFGVYYDHTLMAWFENFRKNFHQFSNHFDNQFYRMWKYYLLCCAGTFRARKNQLWQMVLSPNGVPGGYQPVRF